MSAASKLVCAFALLSALPLISQRTSEAAASMVSRFPVDANLLDVRSLGAIGDGKADDTAAINRAIAASGQSTGYSWWHDRIVYLPRGNYRISSPLLKRYSNGGFGSGLLLIGDGVGQTTITLADHADGYADNTKPRAMIYTTSQLLDRGGPYGGGKDYPRLGEGNDAYENLVESMTIDAGEGNPGAIGIDYLANNLGAVRHVLLRARGESGAVGILMTRKWIGPAILEDVEIDGFGRGIDVASTEYGLTMDDVRLHGQREFALRNRSNVLSIKDLAIDEQGNCKGMLNDTPAGLITLIRSHVRTGAAYALENLGTVVLRMSSATGLSPSRDKAREGEIADGVLSGSHWKAESPWRLSVSDAPAVSDSSPSEWVNVVRFGARPDPAFDSTGAFRKALLSGAHTVYVPTGIYSISGPLTLPPTVRHLAGMNSAIRLLPGREPGFSSAQGLLRILAPSTEPLLIDRLGISNSGEQTGVEVGAARTVVLRDIPNVGVNFLARPAGGGAVFLDNVCCGGMRLAGKERISAEQFDTEGSGVRILNAGAPLSVLGIKTERPNIVLQQGAGGHTEISGGLLYMVLPNPSPDTPAFSIIDSSLIASFAEEAFAPDRTFSFYAVSSQAGKKKIFPRALFPVREGAGSGRLIPLLVVAPEGARANP